MRQPSVLVLLACLLALGTAAGAKQVFLSGATLRAPCSSSPAINADSYTALLLSLTGLNPKKPVDIQTSAEVGLAYSSAFSRRLRQYIRGIDNMNMQMDRILQPYASLQPGSLMSLHVSGRSRAL